ncbi:hypothetical protein SIN07_01375 [Pediococcus inopinatus]|uniref:hypothetical protein n=1 Tax=Pediococcus inopinatus TaxID=114090 RepID=UPI002A6B8860|nr:hypothetical protein [Pediococcus inopinatus]WPP09544.1 hypothetical protein SIN07_01375 [Pediococcus inopinatus]
MTISWLRNHKKQVLLIATSALFIFYAGLLFYKLASVPNLFIDEANYANEVISFEHFGTDMHGLRYPIYFSSAWGQGQSILYSLIARPIIKFFGFSFLTFRFPMVFLSLLLIGLICGYVLFISKNYLATFLMMVIFVTSPGWFVMSRWVLDANIVPVVLGLGLVSLLFSFSTRKRMSSLFSFFISALLVGLSAYGYIATWLYLPIFLVVLVSYLYRRSLLTFTSICQYFAILFVLVLPLIYFAFSIFIKHITQPVKFLWFDIPPLPQSRTSSLIDFSGNLLHTMVRNFLTGCQMFYQGSDGLSRNGTAPFGMIFPWLLVIFTTIAFLANKRLLPEKLMLLKNVCVIALVTFIPVALITTPNYTHWNLVAVPLIILCGLGTYVVVKNLPGYVWLVLLLLTVLLPMTNFVHQYFQPNSSYRTGNIRQFSMQNTKKINQFMENKIKSRLFTDPVSRNFAYFRVYQKPINHKQYLNLQEKKPEFSDRMGPIKRYGYLRNITELNSEYRAKYDYILTISKEDAMRIEKRYGIRLKPVKNFHDGKLTYVLNKLSDK